MNAIFKNSVVHAVVGVAVFGLPLVIASHSPFLDLTLGGVLSLLYHWVSGVYNS